MLNRLAVSGAELVKWPARPTSFFGERFRRTYSKSQVIMLLCLYLLISVKCYDLNSDWEWGREGDYDGGRACPVMVCVQRVA